MIIPCRNDSKYLYRLFRSIKVQGDTPSIPCHVILVDDCSTNGDDIRVLCDSADLDITYLRNDTHLGAAASRNIGFKHARGEFTFFCDADVVLEPHCFARHICALRQNIDCMWSYSNFKVGGRTEKFQHFSDKAMYDHNLCSTMSMVRTFAMPYFHEDLQRFQDWDMFLSLMKRGYKGVWIDETLFFAHDRPGITKAGISWRKGIEGIKRHHPQITARC